MKKMFNVFLSVMMFCAALGFNGSSVFAQDDITVTLNGNMLSFDQPPIIKDERTLVPLRAIFEALGAEVEWNGEMRTIMADKNGKEIFMEIDKTTMFVGDNYAITRLMEGTLENPNEVNIIELDVAPTIVNDRTLVPARAVAESFDCVVDWDADARNVIITSSAAAVTNTDDSGKVLKGIYTNMSNTQYNTQDAYSNACCAYIYNGTVYYSLVYQPIIYAYNGTSTVQYNTGGSPSGIVVTGNNLYYLNENDMNISRIDLQTGSVEILFSRLSKIDSFLIYNGYMYISGSEEGAEGDKAYKVDLSTGSASVIFNSGSEDKDGLALTVKNGKLYLLSLHGVYSIDCETGEENDIQIDEMRGYVRYSYTEDADNIYLNVVAFDSDYFKINTINDSYEVINETEFDKKKETADSGDGYSYSGENSSITRTNVSSGEKQTLIASSGSKKYNYLANDGNIVVFWSGDVNSKLVASADQYSGAVYGALSHMTNGYNSAEIYIMNTDGSHVQLINSYGESADSVNQPSTSGTNSDVEFGTEICTRCNGEGMVTCTVCGGTGQGPDLFMLGEWIEQGCVTCGQTGEIPCPECGGSGRQ